MVGVGGNGDFKWLGESGFGANPIKDIWRLGVGNYIIEVVTYTRWVERQSPKR